MLDLDLSVQGTQWSTPTHIVLADVDAFAANDEGNIDAVIDEQRHAVLLRYLVQFPCHRNQMSRVTRLLAELDDSDTPLEGLLDDMVEGSVAEDRPRRVGDQIQRVVGQLWLPHRDF